MRQVEPPDVQLKRDARRMILTRNRWNGGVRSVLTLILLSSCLLLSGCGSTRFQVDSRVLDDVRSIGKVVAETTSEGDAGGDIEVTNTQVVHVATTKKGNALDEAVKILARRGWNISADNRPTLVGLDSANQPHAYLAISPFDAAYFEDDPQVLERAKKSLASRTRW
ncbi:hypothetical protein [Nonomuraea sp. NPDC049141]|uniref:hypothetical protein n=1 Tax=Nonomuraea sp. NPDC049141 TaxID=3155500 RepID=UPI00340D0B9C